MDEFLNFEYPYLIIFCIKNLTYILSKCGCILELPNIFKYVSYKFYLFLQ